MTGKVLFHALDPAIINNITVLADISTLFAAEIAKLEILHSLLIFIVNCNFIWNFAGVVVSVWVGTSFQKELGDLLISSLCGIMKGGIFLIVSDVRVSSLLDQKLHNLGI